MVVELLHMMRKLTDDELRELLEGATSESRNVEFKPPFVWTELKYQYTKEEVVKAILGMTNTRMGGRVIVGITEDKEKKTISLEGISKENFKSFNDLEGLMSYVDGFSYDSIGHTWEYGEYKDQIYVVISVQEFFETPTICKKDGQIKGCLTKDDIYVRSKKATYGTIRATELEMREIIKMAVDKQKAELKARGWTQTGEVPPEVFFKNQIKDLE